MIKENRRGCFLTAALVLLLVVLLAVIGMRSSDHADTNEAIAATKAN